MKTTKKIISKEYPCLVSSINKLESSLNKKFSSDEEISLVDVVSCLKLDNGDDLNDCVKLFRLCSEENKYSFIIELLSYLKSSFESKESKQSYKIFKSYVKGDISRKDIFEMTKVLHNYITSKDKEVSKPEFILYCAMCGLFNQVIINTFLYMRKDEKFLKNIKPIILKTFSK